MGLDTFRGNIELRNVPKVLILGNFSTKNLLVFTRNQKRLSVSIMSSIRSYKKPLSKAMPQNIRWLKKHNISSKREKD